MANENEAEMIDLNKYISRVVWDTWILRGMIAGGALVGGLVTAGVIKVMMQNGQPTLQPKNGEEGYSYAPHRYWG